MTDVVQDIDRPDVNGVPPKMLGICEALKAATAGIVPVLTVTTDDNVCSSIHFRGSFDAKEKWLYGIFENSRYFRFMLNASGNRRYYTEGDTITAELISCGGNSSERAAMKFRKYTSTPEKVISKLQEWLEKNV